MYIKRHIEHPDGAVDFEGHLTPAEVSMVLEVGLNTLYATGALPFKTKSDLVNIMPHDGDMQ
jgi:hypothetical protein